ncbi:MAG: hypothetical protein IJQ28_06910 [Clostridia bacterium]|nr:hypothetical protein [Clostridia bacterium]
MTDVLFPQEELDRVKLRSTLSGVESELESAGLQDLYDAQVEVLDPERRFNIKNKEERRAAKQEAWDKSYELNHMDTGAYFFEQKNIREEFEQAHTKEMTPDEANALSKEFGLDIKFEKNVSEGNARYAIFEQLKKKGLKEELAALREEGYDYSWLENVGMALTGTYSLTEFGLDAATAIGLAIATAGVGEIGALAADAGKLTGTLGKAFMTAKRLQNVERSIQRSKNVAQIAANSAKLGEIAKEAEIVKNMTFLQKVGWDYYRSMRGMTSPLLRGGTWTPLVASSLDFGLSNIPTALLRSKQAELSGEGTFGETMLREEMIAMALGFGTPVAGRILGLLSKDRRDLNKLSRAVQETLENSSIEKSVVGHTAGARADLEAGRIIQEGTDIIGEKFGTESSPAYREAMKSYFMSNATEMEKEANIAWIKKCLQENKIPNLNEMPNMHIAFSSIPGMRIIMEEAVKAGMSNAELIQRLVKENMVKVVTEGKGVRVDGSIARFSFGNEKNMLGRFAAAGLSPEQAANFAANLYKYAMTGDQAAYAEAYRNILKMRSLKEGIEEVIEAPDQESFYKIVDALKEEGEPSVRETAERYQAVQSEIAEKGHSNLPPEEVMAVAEAYEKDLKSIQELVNFAQGEDENFYAKLMGDLDQAIRENESLLDSENFYKEKFSSPEVFVSRLEGAPDDIFEVGPDNISFEEMQRIKAEDVTYLEAKNKAARSVLANTVEKMPEDVLGSFEQVRKEIDSQIVAPQKKFEYTVSEETVQAIDGIKDTPMNDVASDIVEAIKGTEAIRDLLSSGKKVSTAQFKGVLRGGGEEIVEAVSRLLNDGVLRSWKDKVPELRIPYLKRHIQDLIDSDDFAESLAEVLFNTEKKEMGETLDKVASITAVENWLENVKKPMIQDLLRIQTKHLNNMNTMLRNFNTVVEHAGAYTQEAMHGILSGTTCNIEGSSISIESLQKATANELTKRIEKKLRLSSRGTSASEKVLDVKGEDLFAYYENPENTQSINVALAELSRSAYSREDGQVVADKEALAGLEKAASKGKSGVKYNDRDVRVARIILDTLYVDFQSKLDSVGLGKNFEFRPYASERLSQLATASPEGYVGKVLSIAGVQNKPEAKAFFKTFLPKSDKEIFGKSIVSDIFKKGERKAAEAEANAKCYLLHAINFDSLGYPLEKNEPGLNALRDMIVRGEEINWEDPAIAKKARAIAEYVTDTYEKNVRGNKRNIERFKGEDAYYLDDVERKTLQIMPEFQAEFLDRFGHTNVKNLVNQEIMRASNAYAVVQKLGSKPKQALEDLILSLQTYYGSKAARDKLGAKVVEAALKGVSNDLDHMFLKRELLIAMGNDSVPAGSGARLSTAIREFTSPAMLIVAGARSFSDRAYRTIDAVNNALLSRVPLKDWASLVLDLLRILTGKDKDLAEKIYMKVAIMNDNVVNSAAFKDAKLPFMNTKLNKYATAQDRFKAFAQKFSDNIFRFSQLERITSSNKLNFTMDTMGALGDKFGKSFAELTGEEQVLLRRYDINSADWEFCRKFCIKGLNEYTFEKTAPSSPMFFPDLVADVSDKDLKAFMKEHNIYGSAKKKEVSDALAQRYRSDIADKAACLVHTAVEEGVTMPNARTKAMLQLGLPPNEFLKTITQFASFGLQTTYTHLRRVFAKNIDVHSAIAGNIVADAFLQHPFRTSADLLSYIAWVGAYTAILNELISAAQGKFMKYTLDDGSINPKKVEWLARQFSEPLGAFTTVLDSLNGILHTGVMYFSVAPSVSTLGKQVSKIWGAGKDEEDISDKAIAKAAAVAQAGVYFTGIDRHPLTAALYNSLVGDYLEELALGEDRYEAKQRRRRKQGYDESWADKLLDR